MSFLEWIGFLVAIIGIRWICIHWLPDADAYIVAGGVLGFVLLAIYKRSRSYAIANLPTRIGSNEQTELLAATANSLDSATTEDPPKGIAATETRFIYPRGSRLRALLALIVLSVFGVGFLIPIALGREDDPGNGWVLFVLGGVLVASALLQARALHWLGTSLLITPDGLTHEGHFGRAVHISWRDITGVSTLRFPSRIALSATDGRVIYVYPALCGFRPFIAAAVAALNAAHGAS